MAGDKGTAHRPTSMPGLLAAALIGDYTTLEAELGAYDAQVAAGEAQMLADAADTEG